MKSGVCVCYKEAGISSFGVIARLRKILNIKKIGHTGTLDPDATGVLVVCVGKATKLVEDITHADKVYEAGLLLGITTDTQDISGKVLNESNDFPDKTALIEKIKAFEGELDQIPPMYSAKKINGKKLYELARAGKEIERKPAHIKIHSIDILDIAIPRASIRVSCSSGTYIRTLCHDIGQSLGCGGCMESLLRTRVGDFDIKNAHTLSEIEEFVCKNDFSFLEPIDSFYKEYTRVDVPTEYERIVENGGLIPLETFFSISNNDKYIRVYHPDGRFVGVYSIQKDYAKPYKMYLE